MVVLRRFCGNDRSTNIAAKKYKRAGGIARIRARPFIYHIISRVEFFNRHDESKGNRFIDQQHGNVVADGVEELAILADEPVFDGLGDWFPGAVFELAAFDFGVEVGDERGVSDLEGLMRFGAAEDVEQFLH